MATSARTIQGLALIAPRRLGAVSNRYLHTLITLQQRFGEGVLAGGPGPTDDRGKSEESFRECRVSPAPSGGRCQEADRLAEASDSDDVSDSTDR
jgi:hypothetical protein